MVMGRVGDLISQIPTVWQVQLVALGNPHFSLSECEALARLTRGRDRSDRVELTVTLGRQVMEEARAAGHVAELERFGARLLTDTCWCMLTEPVVPPHATTILTNSAKCAGQDVVHSARKSYDGGHFAVGTHTTHRG